MTDLGDSEVARRVLDLLWGSSRALDGLGAKRSGRRAPHRWICAPTVQGIGVGHRRVCRRECAELAVVLYVSQKLPRIALGASAAPPAVRLPGFDEEIPVDVQPIGTLRLASGIGGGSGISRNRGETGTLTCLVRGRDDGETYLLSCGHVLAWTSPTQAALGDPILSPPFLSEGRAPKDTVATYARGIPLSEGVDNIGDAALARLVAGRSDIAPAIQGISRIRGVGTAVGRGARVRLTGATTTSGAQGTVLSSDFRTSFQYFEPDGTKRTYNFADQVLCSSDFGTFGDSGAAVFDENDLLVGIHLGAGTGPDLPPGVTGGSVFSPIRPMLEALRVDPIFDPAAFDSPAQGPFLSPAPLPTDGPAADQTAGPWKNRDVAVDLLARTVWGEAEGEGSQGMAAVAWVVVNRAMCRKPMGWGRNIEEVCTWPSQFDCWRVRRERMMALTWQTQAEKTALSVTQDVLTGRLGDPTGGAMWFHVIGQTYSFTQKLVECARINHHVFYKEPN